MIDIDDFLELIRGGFLVGDERHWEVTLSDGTIWVVSMRPIGEVPA